jgi:hypothetical protein
MQKVKSRLLAATMILAAVGGAVAPARAQWTQYQGDASHTGFVAANLAGNNPIQLWSQSFTYDGSATTHTAVSVDSSGVYTNVYAGKDSVQGWSFTLYNLTSINPSTGQQQWATQVAYYSPDAVSAPSVGNGLAYVMVYGEGTGSGSDSPQIVGAAESNGQIQFDTAVAGQWTAGSQPTVLGTQVVTLGGYYGGMNAFNGTTGAVQWSITDLPQQYDFIPAMNAQNIYIYYGAAGYEPGPETSTLYTVSPTNGGIKSEITNPSDITTTYSSISSPVLGSQNDVLVVGNTGMNGPKEVYCLDLIGQTVKWQAGTSVVNAIAVSNGQVAIPTNLALELVSESTGATIWNWLPASGVDLTSNVVMTNQFAFVASDNRLYEINLATGTLAGSAYLGLDPLNSSIPYSLAFYNGELYVSGDSTLFAFTFSPVPAPPGLLLGSAGFALMAVRFGVRSLRRTSRRVG